VGLRFLKRSRVYKRDIIRPVVAEGKSSEVKCARIRVRGLCCGYVGSHGAGETPIRITCRIHAKSSAHWCYDCVFQCERSLDIEIHFGCLVTGIA